jgi:hypothetical protein
MFTVSLFLVTAMFTVSLFLVTAMFTVSLFLVTAMLTIPGTMVLATQAGKFPVQVTDNTSHFLHVSHHFMDLPLEMPYTVILVMLTVFMMLAIFVVSFMMLAIFVVSFMMLAIFVVSFMMLAIFAVSPPVSRNLAHLTHQLLGKLLVPCFHRPANLSAEFKHVPFEFITAMLTIPTLTISTIRTSAMLTIPSLTIPSLRTAMRRTCIPGIFLVRTLLILCIHS